MQTMKGTQNLIRIRYLPIMILSVAILLWGCKNSNDNGTNSQGTAFTVLYELSSTMGNRDFAPYPNDIWFVDSNGSDGTLNIPQPPEQSSASADRNREFVNTLDGFSTTSTIRIPFTGEIDFNTIEPLNPLAPTSTANIIILDAVTDEPLIPEKHYTIQHSGTKDLERQSLTISLLSPLKQKTTYLFYVMSGIADIAGVPIQPASHFQQIKDAWLNGSSIADVYLDMIASDVIGPAIDKAINILGYAPENIMAAWSISTQSVTDVIEVISNNAEAQSTELNHSGLSTNDVIETLPGFADIYVGTTTTPYYLSKNNPYDSIWLTAQGTQPNRFNPVAVPTATINIPLLITLPNATSRQAKPPVGWPVMIFMHGIGGNRTQAIAIADRMAAVGFAVVSIDHTLHGITDPNNPFFQGPGNPSPLNVFGDNERNFFLDRFNNTTGAQVPDGIIDNGTQVLNATILKPLNGRDTLRQTSADLIHLALTIPTIDLDGDQTPDLDGSRISYTGLSWSALQGPLFLGVTERVVTASLSSPGGTWSDLLTDSDSHTFGIPLLNQLASLGIVFNTAEFDCWIRDWQNVLDPVDSLNFALATAARNPIHIIEMLDDTVIPNGPTEKFATLIGSNTISGTTQAPPGETLNNIVRFTSGSHASAISSSTDSAVTSEIQSQLAVFAASGGTRIPIDPTCDYIL
ncbi:MAG: hypothetical protein K1563_19765 [Candidatus Thiodiazotropha sp. (ex. Lucinisca nassula)]|nr:hypothetical protein [Candidatus Thiodiazotropha sp. (ex. Lucinisca nassula)]MBW9275919.1 hypothetical protein [Candidatus Thiodiazotropha sp. (ex. Lucinisca nassula)]